MDPSLKIALITALSVVAFQYIGRLIQARALGKTPSPATLLEDENLRLRQQEQKLSAELAHEHAARLEAQAVATTLRDEQERYRHIDETLVAIKKDLDGSALPEVLRLMTERTASLVLARIPDNAEREQMAAAASLGGLMSAHGYVAMAINAMLLKVKAMGGTGDDDVYSIQHINDAEDEEPPSSGSLN